MQEKTTIEKQLNIEESFVGIKEIETTLQSISTSIDRLGNDLSTANSNEIFIEFTKLTVLMTTVEKQINTTILPLQQRLENIRKSPVLRFRSGEEKDILVKQLVEQIELGQQNINVMKKLREELDKLGEQIKAMQIE